MRKVLQGLTGAALIAGLALLAGCCSWAEKNPGTDKAEVYCPAPDGKAVMEYITKDNPYKQWELWPGKGELYEGQHPHGAYLTTYVSPLAYGAIESKGAEMLDTSFIVKENYTKDKKLAAVTVMYKKEGYNPQGGDWFWLKYTPDGTIEAEGKVAGCIDCHKSASDNDWLFTGPIK